MESLDDYYSHHSYLKFTYFLCAECTVMSEQVECSCCEHTIHSGVLAAHRDAAGVDSILNRKVINKRTGAQFRFFTIFNLVLIKQNVDARSAI